MLQHKAVGFWWTVAPEAERLRAIEAIDDWDPNFGDRRQEIAISGIDMDETALRRWLAGAGGHRAQIVANKPRQTQSRGAESMRNCDVDGAKIAQE